MIIGIAGGIGSGKTLATDYLKKHYQFEVLDNDVTAREIVAPGTPVLDQIIQHFGADIILANGELNRPELRSRIFNNPSEKSWLESVTHPAIREKTLKAIQQTPGNAVLLLVSPLLFESGQHKLCDATLAIVASKELQLTRALTRDGSSLATIENIMLNQMNNEQRIELADQVLYNDSTIEDFYQQLDKIAQSWIKKLK